jgi:hypothetical protein
MATLRIVHEVDDVERGGARMPDNVVRPETLQMFGQV